ncbi:MAG: potassium-transporting ATPase subunit KdpB [Gammaproteobacteria bacterium]|nr:potassium-transporting ATPase subunit KdpB [Gammaproteobacteria bacterium]
MNEAHSQSRDTNRQRRGVLTMTPDVLWRLAKESVLRLDPRALMRNPVMFVVGAGTLVSAWFTAAGALSGEPFGVELSITTILLLTVMFANGAEALAEAHGKAHASSLRSAREQLMARRVMDSGEENVSASELRRGDKVKVSADELIPTDGEIIEGAATINESAITGESAPVLREAGTDHSGVSAGTKVLSDEIVIEVSADPGNTLLDRMIALVESAKRQKTPNEVALTVLLAAMTLIFMIVVVSLVPMAGFLGAEIPIPILVALLVCLIPTTIGGLLPAIGIAGMGRAICANLVAKSGKAVEVAGNIDTLLLDKTGTITIGDRQATEFQTIGNVRDDELRNAAFLSSLPDPTPEGQSTVRFARDHGADESLASDDAKFIKFSAETRLFGVDLPDGRRIRKGAQDAIRKFVTEAGGQYPRDADAAVERIARKGATPLVVANDSRVLGVIALSDVIKPGVKEKLRRLSEVGVRTVMITGDNPLTAAAIAAEAGVDDYKAEVTPEAKLNLIRAEQKQGRLVAMMGDGTNDAPALAQADLGLAMNSGTQAAREAANMVDLDSDPGKLIEVVEIGKQLLITRGALTTFSLANAVAKYFVILPAIFAAGIPALSGLDILQMHSPTSAVLSAVISNALVIPALVPFALRGVRYKPQSSSALLRRNVLIYGLGGVLLPFPAIKLIDVMLSVII